MPSGVYERIKPSRRKGKPLSESHKEALRKGSKKRWAKVEEHEKASMSQKGKTSPLRGIPHSEEHLVKVKSKAAKKMFKNFSIVTEKEIFSDWEVSSLWQ